MSTNILTTPRLRLVPATSELLAAALESRDALARALEVAVADTWPPQFVDDDALRYAADRLDKGSEQDGWWLYFIVLTNSSIGDTLIGTAGYKGPPTAEGLVEVGYGIVNEHHRRGFATETTEALLARAFSVPEVAAVIAETLPELIASIGVMTKCGFEYAGEGSEPRVVRYRLSRDRWEHDARVG